MANVIDSISIKGLRKAHLRQLAKYIHACDPRKLCYGTPIDFYKRHNDILKLADVLKEIADDHETIIVK